MSNYTILIYQKKCVGQTFGKMGISGKRQFDLDIEFFKFFYMNQKLTALYLFCQNFVQKKDFFLFYFQIYFEDKHYWAPVIYNYIWQLQLTVWLVTRFFFVSFFEAILSIWKNFTITIQIS